MTKNIKIVISSIVILVIIIGIYGFKNLKQDSDSVESFKVGVIAGFTGPASTWADMSKKGIELAVKETNQAGGINGKQLEIIYEDSQTNPVKGVTAFNKLVSQDQVSIVFGDVWSFLTNPLIPLADQKKVILISPTVMDVSVEKTSPYFYTMGHTIDSQRVAIEKFFDLNKDIKTLSVLYWNDLWGGANKDLLLDIAANKGVKILSIEGTNDFSSTYQSEITKIKAINPDAIYFNSSLPDVVLRRIKDLGLGNKKVLTLSNAVDAIEVTKTPLAYLANVYFTNWVPNEEFTSKFKKEYDIYPIIEAQNSYDMTRGVISALQVDTDLITSLKTIKFTGVEGYLVDFTKKDQSRVNEGRAALYIYDGNYKKIN